MQAGHEQTIDRSALGRLASLLTVRRLAVWGTAFCLLGWSLHLYTTLTPGYVDRDGRFKGSDYIQFYVMGSMVLEGSMDALYDSDAHLSVARRRIHPELGLFAGHANYGPHVALAFAPLATLPFGWSLAVFLALSGGAYAASVWILWTVCPGLRRYGWLVLLLAAGSPLLLTAIRYGQLSAFTLLLWSLALAALVRNRRFAAGLAIGCLVYKPQLGIVVGVMLLAAREWRMVAGALTTGLGQLLLGWLAGGTALFTEYLSVLWLLMLSPGLVQLYPSEVHSLRGFFQLLIASPALVTACFVPALCVVLFVAVRTWLSPSSWQVKWSQAAVLTVLASPHLLAYDLLLLTVPLVALADWSVRNAAHPARAAVSLLLVPLYFAPFSGNLARAIHVQLSVVAMAALAYVVARRTING